jgi:hypothetical protein
MDKRHAMHLPKLTLDGSRLNRFPCMLSLSIDLVLWKMPKYEAQVILSKRNAKLSLNDSNDPKTSAL